MWRRVVWYVGIKVLDGPADSIFRPIRESRRSFRNSRNHLSNNTTSYQKLSKIFPYNSSYLTYVYFVSLILLSSVLISDIPFCRVRQKYLTNLQNSCGWNRWRGEFVLERSSSETQSISVAMERWSVEHRAFVVETYFKNKDSVLTQRIFRRHFNIHGNECP
jgi:hypothetical protein